MIDWLNKQNKKHILLSRQEENLNQQDSIIWFEIALNARMGALNKKISKVSPRRHKKDYAKSIKKLLSDEPLTTEFNLQEVIEILEDEHS